MKAVTHFQYKSALANCTLLGAVLAFSPSLLAKTDAGIGATAVKTIVVGKGDFKINDVVFVSDEFQTKDQGTTTILFHDESILTLYAGAHAKVEVYEEGKNGKPGRSVIRVMNGQFRFFPGKILESGGAQYVAIAKKYIGSTASGWTPVGDLNDSGTNNKAGKSGDKQASLKSGGSGSFAVGGNGGSTNSSGGNSGGGNSGGGNSGGSGGSQSTTSNSSQAGGAPAGGGGLTPPTGGSSQGGGTPGGVGIPGDSGRTPGSRGRPTEGAERTGFSPVTPGGAGGGGSGGTGGGIGREVRESRLDGLTGQGDFGNSINVNGTGAGTGGTTGGQGYTASTLIIELGDSGPVTQIVVNNLGGSNTLGTFANGIAGNVTSGDMSRSIVGFLNATGAIGTTISLDTISRNGLLTPQAQGTVSPSRNPSVSGANLSSEKSGVRSLNTGIAGTSGARNPVAGSAQPIAGSALNPTAGATLNTTVGPASSPVTGAVVGPVSPSNFSPTISTTSTLPTNAIALPTNAIALPTNAIALPTNAIAVPTNAIAVPTNAIALPTNAIANPTTIPIGRGPAISDKTGPIFRPLAR